MMSNVFAILMMGGMFLLMWNKATLTSTRRMAMLPLGICVVEVLTFGLLTVGLFPVLSVLLWMARLTVFACCGMKLRQDRMVARRRVRRRILEEKRQMVLQHEACRITVLPRCA
ncbi:MAG: hypothetical protein IJZ13_02815 [Clostridia bacterium]|nr:hypothetical protein [Clostridia bacterium]